LRRSVTSQRIDVGQAVQVRAPVAVLAIIAELVDEALAAAAPVHHEVLELHQPGLLTAVKKRGELAIGA